MPLVDLRDPPAQDPREGRFPPSAFPPPSSRLPANQSCFPSLVPKAATGPGQESPTHIRFSDLRRP
jgi:hypothetical protein